MGRLIDLTGKKIGRWIVVSHLTGIRPSKWLVRCECGTEALRTAQVLRDGRSRSCGCLSSDLKKQRRKGSIAKDGEKKCARCLKTKSVVEYYRSSNNKTDGYSNYCRQCNRSIKLIDKYGVGLEVKLDLIRLQKGLCANGGCGEAINGSAPLDHCHSTGKIRGVLCTRCNHALGHARDSESVLLGLVKYLKESNLFRAGISKAGDPVYEKEAA